MGVTSNSFTCARDRVALEQEVRHPERVDHVVGGQLDAVGLADRQPRSRARDALAARLAHDLDALVGEGEPPSPRNASTCSVTSGSAETAETRSSAANREREQHDHDHHRDRRVDDLERHVRVELATERGVVVAATPPVPHERPPEQAVDDRRDPDRGPEEDLPQAEDLLALARSRRAACRTTTSTPWSRPRSSPRGPSTGDASRTGPLVIGGGRVGFLIEPAGGVAAEDHPGRRADRSFVAGAQVTADPPREHARDRRARRTAAPSARR